MQTVVQFVRPLPLPRANPVTNTRSFRRLVLLDSKELMSYDFLRDEGEFGRTLEQIHNDIRQVPQEVSMRDCVPASRSELVVVVPRCEGKVGDDAEEESVKEGDLVRRPVGRTGTGETRGKDTNNVKNQENSPPPLFSSSSGLSGFESGSFSGSFGSGEVGEPPSLPKGHAAKVAHLRLRTPVFES